MRKKLLKVLGNSLVKIKHGCPPDEKNVPFYKSFSSTSV
jgi:hypothetical protein